MGEGKPLGALLPTQLLFGFGVTYVRGANPLLRFGQSWLARTAHWAVRLVRNLSDQGIRAANSASC